ncbi:inorganic pyrophosphatase [Syncephalastrum racemosum]|uniref:inorganic diphosphatase n=1 Tax=Syncephalastrum racemosum TaxID=13706 RepID=A0A1X2HW71_SYNRA|nr:inorganic pyrophosphatase [Syncephalastrum racemosum]
MVQISLLSLATIAITMVAASPKCADIDCLYKLRSTGAMYTKDFALYHENAQGTPISTWHDIPIQPDPEDRPDVYNMLIEIPRWEIAKFETNKETGLNPIKQDILDGNLRFLPNVYPNKGYPANYGAFMQTWEDPDHITPDLNNTKGDNDPIDVVDISASLGFPGEIRQVKILGGLALIDEGESDWKVIVIDIHDPRAREINDIQDVDRLMPGYLDAIRHWYEVYKVPDGEDRNRFGFEGKYQNKEYMKNVVDLTRGFWEALVNGTRKFEDEKSTSDFKVANLLVPHSPYQISKDDSQVRNIPDAQNDRPPADIDPARFNYAFVN